MSEPHYKVTLKPQINGDWHWGLRHYNAYDLNDEYRVDQGVATTRDLAIAEAQRALDNWDHPEQIVLTPTPKEAI